jgi:hypothetical protein
LKAEIDIRHPNCGGILRVIAAILERPVIAFRDEAAKTLADLLRLVRAS